MTINLNLLPWREARQAQNLRQFYVALGLVVGVASLVLIMGRMSLAHSADTQSRLSLRLKQEVVILEQKIQSIETLAKEKEALENRMRSIESLDVNRGHTITVFNALVQSVPSGLVYTEIAREGDTLSLMGEAPSNTAVSNLMRQLDAAPIFHTPTLNFVALPDETDDPVIGFHLQVSQIPAKGALNEWIID